MQRDTSLAALSQVDLQAQETELMRLIRYHYQVGKFTRKELASRTGWTINVICGRVFTLVKKGLLTEYPQTRDGAHLLSVSAAPATLAKVESAIPPAEHSASGKLVPSLTIAPAPPVAAEFRPHERLIHTHKKDGTPFSYTAVGIGPGWPPDQDHLHRGRR